MAENNNSNLQIIETNLIPSYNLEKNLMNCSIIIDSSLTSNASIYSMNEKAKNNGQPMFTHHYFISKDGKIFRGRQEQYKSYIDDKFGKNAIGIMLEGNFNEEQIELIQFNTLLKLIYDILARNKYIGNSIFVHSELDRECNSPGTLFPYVNFKNRIYRNFTNITDTSDDIVGKTYYIFGSRDLEYKVPNMKGSDIYQLKMIMLKLGYNITSLDEIYDYNLKEIIINYCKDYNIYKESYYNGILTKEELIALDDRMSNLVKSREGRYKRYLKLTNPVMTGKDISILKTKLWAIGIYTGTLDNKYDETMVKAVKEFQSNNELYDNGEVDSIVYENIMNSNVYIFTRVLVYNPENLMEGSDISIIQKSLLKKGYNINVNGYYDINTFNIVKQYQLDNNLEPTGIVNNITFDYIIG